jgi:hypothetical protein
MTDDEDKDKDTDAEIPDGLPEPLADSARTVAESAGIDIDEE